MQKMKCKKEKKGVADREEKMTKIKGRNSCTHPMLEEIWIKVLVEAVFKLDPGLLPVDLIGEFNLGPQFQLLPGL